MDILEFSSVEGGIVGVSRHPGWASDGGEGIAWRGCYDDEGGNMRESLLDSWLQRDNEQNRVTPSRKSKTQSQMHKKGRDAATEGWKLRYGNSGRL